MMIFYGTELAFVKENPVMGRYFAENLAGRAIWGIQVKNARDTVFGAGRLKLYRYHTLGVRGLSIVITTGV